MKMDMKKWMQEVSNSSERYAVPVMTFPGADILGENIMGAVTDGNIQYEIIKALADKYPAAAAMTNMDLSVEAEAFGSPVRYSENEVPTVTSGIVSDMESISALRIPDIGEARTAEYLHAARLAARTVTDRPVFGGEIGPVSLAARLYDMSEMLMALITEPRTIHTLLDKAATFLVNYAKAFKNAGANGIIISEPAAGLLSPELCTEFSSEYVKRIVDAVQDNNFIVIIHNCGNTVKLVPSLLSTGAAGFHFGNAVDMTDIMPQIPWGRLAFGNIDPAGMFKNGTVDEIKAETWNLLEKTAIYKNFVLSSGCDIPHGTPLENINAFFNTLKRFNREILATDAA